MKSQLRALIFYSLCLQHYIFSLDVSEKYWCCFWFPVRRKESYVATGRFVTESNRCSVAPLMRVSGFGVFPRSMGYEKRHEIVTFV